MNNNSREHWGSKIGVILAVAGSAVGLGNFLRFPVQAAENGGGAFIIPYFIAFLLLGVPLCWVEWTLGRYGGKLGHGTAPGIFDKIIKTRWAKYLGIVGLFGPLVIFIYYVYVESWTLAFSYFAFSGEYAEAARCNFDAIVSDNPLKGFLADYQGIGGGEYFTGFGTAYLFFVLTFVINFAVIYRGVTKGIERFSKIAMPLLLIFALVILVRVLTLGSPVTDEWSIEKGFGFLWNSDFEKLGDANVWLAATGQIFFTLSVGMGVIMTYASYVKKKEDIALSALSAASTNEFIEVVIASSILIPAGFIFLGPSLMKDVASQGAFDLGFVTMPFILEQIPLGAIFGGMWFLLLFIAGITSSLSLIQPLLAFLEDEFEITRQRAVVFVGIFTFIMVQPVIFFLGHGFMDELDFWGVNVCIVLFATVEIFVFAIFLGVKKGWEELHEGAKIKVPKIFKFIITFVTPLYLLTLIVIWFVQYTPKFLMEKVPQEDFYYQLGARLMLLLLIAILLILVWWAWKRKKKTNSEVNK